MTVEAIAGLTATLLAITVAQAALPNPDAPTASKPDLRTLAPVETAAVAVEPAGPQPAFSFGAPVEGYPVISPFGLRKLPWEEAGRLHQGVDIAAPSGLPVTAVEDGVVIEAGRDGGYGRYVAVRHDDGLTSFYAHLGTIEAVAGAAVRKGQPIGRIGSTGSSTGAHLHFEMRDEKGRPLNPVMFLGRDFAAAEDLPMREARRFPRYVRTAYVSFIPQAKRELMEAREEAKVAAAEAKKAEAAARRLMASDVRASTVLTLAKARIETVGEPAAALAKADRPFVRIAAPAVPAASPAAPSAADSGIDAILQGSVSETPG